MNVPRTNFLQKAGSAALTYAEWARLGFPGRPPEETAQLFREHCAGCDAYDPEGRAIPVIGPKGLCRDCGCHVSDDATEWTNKVAILVAGCPRKYWLPIVEKEG